LTLSPELQTKLSGAREKVWLRLGAVRELIDDTDGAIAAYKNVLMVNPRAVKALTQIGSIMCKLGDYTQALRYLQRALLIDVDSGPAWAQLAHCYIMTDDSTKAYQAYFRALTLLDEAQDPGFWYGLGVLHHRCWSLEPALAAFMEVLKTAPTFEHRSEVLYRVGIIHKENKSFSEALEFFNKVIETDSPALYRVDALFEIGHVHELQNDLDRAVASYRSCLEEKPEYSRAIQHMAWVLHCKGETAEGVRLLQKLTEIHPTNPHTYYLRARINMDCDQHTQAYEALQQALVFNDQNPFYWCTIGVLYKRMTQFRDAMDAYTRAIRINPHVFEVWFNLGALYETCGQSADSLDAYERAVKLEPENAEMLAALDAARENVSAAREKKSSHVKVPKPMLPSTNPFAPVLRALNEQQRNQQRAAMRRDGIDLEKLTEEFLHQHHSSGSREAKGQTASAGNVGATPS